MHSRIWVKCKVERCEEAGCGGRWENEKKNCRELQVKWDLMMVKSTPSSCTWLPGWYSKCLSTNKLSEFLNENYKSARSFRHIQGRWQVICGQCDRIVEFIDQKSYIRLFEMISSDLKVLVIPLKPLDSRISFLFLNGNTAKISLR